MNSNHSLNRHYFTTACYASCLLLPDSFLPQVQRKYSENDRMWVVADASTAVSKCLLFSNLLSYLLCCLCQLSNSYKPEISLMSLNAHRVGAGVGHLMVIFCFFSHEEGHELDNGTMPSLFLSVRQFLVRDSAWVGTSIMLARFCVCKRPSAHHVLTILCFYNLGAADPEKGVKCHLSF